ncbi:GIY-YIG nuclease family protein, partial [Roseisolibacter sp. H3M3-2]|uniref:GIY-YIG nuclease family protein n=1 Tax=Roseisolibacter sp. H3M3-2 TaxID=3031323 RepID=UPI0023DBE5A7
MPRRTQLRAPVQPDDLRHVAYAPAPVARRKALLAQVKAECRDVPGVYRMLGATGLVLYVGKAKRLRTRLLSYFRSARTGGRRDKQARILRHAHALEWEVAPDEFAALLRELRLIKRHRPRFNVMMNVDEAPRGWLMVTHGPVPALRVVQRTDDAEAAVLYGPFRRLSMLTEAARALADATGVRDCALPPSQLPAATPARRRRALGVAEPSP